VEVSGIFEIRHGKKCVANNNYKFSKFIENTGTTKVFIAEINNIQ
jgi:hypothetical protein